MNVIETNQNDITNETKKEFAKNECENIGNERKWIKNCPECHKEMSYKTEGHLIRSIREEKTCSNCHNKIKARTGYYKRNCPDCGIEIIYKSKRGYFVCKKKNSVCLECVKKKFSILRKGKPSNRKGCHLTKEHKKRIGEVTKWRHKMYGHPMTGRHHKKDAIEKFKLRLGSKNGMYGKHHTFKTRKKISLQRIGMKLPTVSENTRRKLRISRINQISKLKYDGNPIIPSFNKLSCIFFDEINQKFNLNGVYATNKGEYHIKELGYFLDYYEPNLNLVIEWDEPHHYYCGGKLTPKDKLRQYEIKRHLKCKFIRIKENKLDKSKILNKIYEYIKNKS